MDIARLLTPSDADLSDAEPFVGVVFSPQTPPPSPNAPNAAAHASNKTVTCVTPRRRSNRRRKPSLESLRAQVQALEAVAANLPHVLRDLDDNASASTSSAWREHAKGRGDDNDNDDGSELVRAHLRRTVVLSEHEQHERAKQTELLRMLKRHLDSAASLRKLMRGLSLNDWHWTCERWRLLTTQYFKPLRTSRVYRLVQDTLQAIDRFQMPRETDKRNTSFFGWRDAQILVQDQRFVYFLTRKTQPHGAIQETADHTWSIYEDGHRYKQYMLGDNCELFHQILQRVTPDIMVMQTVEQYRGMTKCIHSLSIVFRVATETGYLIVVRCAALAPELENVMACEGLAIGDNFFWCAWDVTQRDADGTCLQFQSTFGGHIGADYDQYARWWATELVLALVRAETNMGTPLLTLETEEEPEPERSAP